MALIIDLIAKKSLKISDLLLFSRSLFFCVSFGLAYGFAKY